MQLQDRYQVRVTLNNDFLVINDLESSADEIVALLQGSGGHPPVDINARNAYDRTALHWAAGNNNVIALKILIQMGAQIDAKVGSFINSQQICFNSVIRINLE